LVLRASEKLDRGTVEQGNRKREDGGQKTEDGSHFGFGISPAGVLRTDCGFKEGGRKY
jgi:hypothetical protein